MRNSSMVSRARLQRARHISKVAGALAVAREKIVQQFSAIDGLLTPARVEQRIAPSLQPRFYVEIGLAVADEIEDRHDGSARPRHHSLPTVISGASGCFMPTT